MTHEDYKKKLDAYKASSAPVDVKEKAIADLNAKYFGSSANPDRYKQIVSEIREGSADISDID